ncbi:hypothetical protein [Chryseobacterium wanjuense]
MQPIIFGLYSVDTITEEHVYLSTPSSNNITVTVRMADGITIPNLRVTNINTSASTFVNTGSITLNNNSPVRINMVDASNVILAPGNSPLTPATTMAGTIIPAELGGIIFQSSDNFFVNYRGRSGQQAGSVLTKGKAALGKNFFGEELPTNTVLQSQRLGIWLL